MAELLADSDIVNVTLKLWAKSRFEWGTNDCTISVFRYLADRGHSAPFRKWVGQYVDEAGANKLLSEHGGALCALSAEMISVGFARTRTPKRGDIGIVRSGDNAPLLAICCGNGWWAARSQKGFAVWRPRFPVAWSVP